MMNECEQIRVLVADDHAAVREGLVSVLKRRQMQIVAEASNGQEAIELYRQHRPDILLMDLRMPLMDGLAATRAIVAEFPDARILILTNSKGEEENSRKAGAKALLQKDMPAEQIIQAIQAVHKPGA